MSRRHRRTSSEDLLTEVEEIQYELDVRDEEAGLDESPEKSEALEEACGEQLQMHVIPLNDGNQAEVLGHLGHLLWAVCREIDGESEEVLALWTAAHDFVLADVSEPGGVYEVRVYLTHEAEAIDKILIQRKKWL